MDNQDAQIVAGLPAPDEIMFMLMQCSHVTSAILRLLTTGSAKITEIALWDVAGHHSEASAAYAVPAYAVCSWCGAALRLAKSVSCSGSRCSQVCTLWWTVDGAASLHNLVRFPQLKALSFHCEVGAVPANGVASAKITVSGVLMFTQLPELSYIGLGSLHGLTRLIVKQLDTLVKLFQRTNMAKASLFVAQLELTH